MAEYFLMQVLFSSSTSAWPISDILLFFHIVKTTLLVNNLVNNW